MSDMMVQRESQYPPVAAPPPVAPAPASAGSPLAAVLASARRHWLMILLVWVLVAAPAAAGLWRFMGPMYTASGFVEVAPVDVPILAANPVDSLGGLEGFLNTQAQLVSSGQVLRTALADPIMTGLPVMQEQDPISELRESIKAVPVSRSFLLRVDVTRQTRDEALRIARAVMASYKMFAGGAEEARRTRDTEILTAEQKLLAGRKTNLEEVILNLAQQQGSSSEQVYDLLRESKIKIGSELEIQLANAKAEKAQLEARLSQLEKGLVPMTMPAQDLDWKEQQVENDEMVRSLRAELARVAQTLAKLGRHAGYEEQQRTLRERFEKERARADAEAQRRLDQRREAILAIEMDLTQEQIRAAANRVEELEKGRSTAESSGLNIGQTALQIKRKQEELETCKQDLQKVEDRLRQLEIEGKRPNRITVRPESVEIFPEGVQDKRRKVIPVAVIGSLFLGVGLAFLRDFASGRLYTAADVTQRAGLRLLGGLPSLDDLRRGQVTEDDFRESYRAIRATLAGISPDGRVPRVLLVTSAQAAEGKTSLAVSLAGSLAETGARVLVVDGDVQAPRIGQTLRIRPPFTLRNVLLGDRKLAEAVSPTPVPGLDVLTAGRNGHSAEGLLTRELAAAFLQAAAESYDHVVIDTPPVLGSADALIWAQVADGVILSSFSGHSSLRTVHHACERIASVGALILGTVVCNMSVRESYYSYSSSGSLRSQAAADDDDRAGAGPSGVDAKVAPAPGRAPPCIHLPAKRPG